MLFFSRVKRTPTLLQMEAAECGAASLGIILAYHGLHLPLETLRQDCGVNRDGSKASNIVKAARRHHLVAEGVRCSADELAKQRLPAILHWEFRHFVVLEGFRGGRAYINDPGFGHRALPMDEFRSAYTGVAMVFSPGPDFRRGGKPFSVLAALGQKMRREKAALAFVLLASALLIIPGLAVPVFSQVFLDDVLSGKHQDWMAKLLFVMGVVCVTDVLLTGIRSWCLTRWQTKLTLVDSARFFWHVIRLPISFFQQRFSGEIAMRVQFNESVANILTGNLATVALDFAVAVFFLFVLVQYSWQLTLISLLFTFLNLFLLSVMRKRIFELAMRMQQDSGKLMATAIGGLQTIETLKANGNENDFFAKWSGHQAKCYRQRQQMDMLVQTLSVGPAFFNAVNAALIMLVGGMQIMDGVMTAGVFMAFRNLVGNFQEPMQRIFNMGQTLQTTEMQMRRLEDVLNYKTADAAVSPRREVSRKLSGGVELHDVTFGYSPLGPPLISLFDLAIRPGRWVALVGGSGSGKSTIANIVCGLFKEWSGEILFDGYARNEIPAGILANSVSVVGQDITIFSGTVRENIALFDLTLPDADIIRAASDAMIHDDISRLDGGFEHQLAEGGANLSGGQRQRIEIARALANNPSLLILDEATSALDPVTEERILQNIRRRGCACLMSAHRLSAFRDCDEIVVLDWGHVVERGTHSEMIRRDGPYRRLVGGQDGPGGETA